MADTSRPWRSHSSSRTTCAPSSERSDRNRPTPSPAVAPGTSLQIGASARVLRRLRARGLDGAERGVLLGRHFLTFRGLAERCAAETGVPVRHLLDDPAFARVVGHCAAGVESLAPLLERQPRVAADLASTLRDLRDAGVPPAAVGGDLGRLYALCEAAMATLEREAGIFDRIGLFRLARGGASAWAARLRLGEVTVHGAHDLVGSVGDLLESLSRAVSLRLLHPDPDDPWGETLRRRFPWSFQVDTVSPGGSNGASWRVLRTAGGPLEEFETTCREILALLERGRPPSTIAVVARTLEPYAAWLPTVLERAGIPVDCSLAQPALLYDAARSVLRLARVLFDDLDRDSLVDLCLSPRLDRGAIRGGDTRRLPGIVERLGRHAGIEGGAEGWRRALEETSHRPRSFERSEEMSVGDAEWRGLGRLLDLLGAESRRARRSATTGEAVRMLRRAADRWLRSRLEQDPAGDAVLGSVDEALQGIGFLDTVDRTLDRPPQTGPGDALATVEASLRSVTLSPLARQEGGVSILDAVQARGLVFDHLFVIGLNEGVWPRALDEDGFLPDRERRDLRDRLGRPVPVRMDWQEEERFLLRLITAQARRTVTLSYATLDRAGRPLASSPYLWQVLPGTHRSTRSPTGTLPTPAEEILAEPTIARDAGARERVLAAAPLDDADRIRRAVGVLGLVERPDPADLRYDGVIDPGTPPLRRTLSPTLLEGLGACPMRAFFAAILGVPEGRARTPLEPDAADRGAIVHSALEAAYSSPGVSDAVRGASTLDAAVERATEVLAREIEERLRLPGRIPDEHRHLRAAVRDRWTRALAIFLRRDLERLLDDGVTDVVCEEKFDLPLEVSGREVTVRGKIDRRVKLSRGRIRVSDYKTGATPGGPASPVRVRRGLAWQLPLYAIASARACGVSEVEAEVLHAPLRVERRRGRGDPLAYGLAWSSAEAVREQIDRPLEVLVGLLHEGHYPFRESDECRFCPYTIACRKGHPASVERIEASALFADYRDLAGGGS